MIQFSIALCSVLLISAATAEVYDFDNNIIEFGPGGQTKIYPYPYQAVKPSHNVYSYNKHNHPEVVVPAHKTEIVVPAHEAEIIEVVKPTGFISTAISCVINGVKSVVVFLLTNIPGLIAGSAVALGLCKLTSLCDFQVTIYEAQSELRSLATPERLSIAAKFVKEALKKYNDMQKK